MRVVAILPAYNASKTLKNVLQSLPKGVFEAIVVSDDHSVDDTMIQAAKISHITLIQTPKNLGYGGNVKYCLSYALSVGADVIVEIHPDAEYKTDGIGQALKEVEKGAQLVLGNRLSRHIVGMYWWKHFGTRLLSCIDNIALGTRIPDMHQGFRVYTKELLQSVPYRHTHNDYLFSFEIIAQAVKVGARVVSVSVTAHYSGNKRGARTGATIKYVFGTFCTLFQYYISMIGLSVGPFLNFFDNNPPRCPTCLNSFLVRREYTKGKWSIYRCDGCMHTFCAPVPVDMSPWYRQEYYEQESVVGRWKKTLYSYFQKRRTCWVSEYVSKGVVVDVGSGTGDFGKNMGENVSVIDIETTFAAVSNPKTLRVDFLNWKPKKPVDAVVFWESLEHVPNPLMYLAHAASIVKKGGYVFIEYPRFDSLESRLFGSRWYHLDLPRHLSQLTDGGVSYLLAKAGFHSIYKKSIWAPEYAIVGFAASVFGMTADDLMRQRHNPLFFLLFLPMLMVSCLTESILFLFDESPIGFVVAKKP